jgi:hypothetical protein
MKAMVVLAALRAATYAAATRATSLPVVIEKLNAAATACGISEPQLESVALRTREGSPFQSDADAGGWLHVHVTVTQTRRNPCAAHISVKMKAFRKPSPSGVMPDPKQRSRVPVVVHCSKSSDYSAPKDHFSSEIESAMEYSIRQCLGSLKYRRPFREGDFRRDPRSLSLSLSLSVTVNGQRYRALEASAPRAGKAGSPMQSIQPCCTAARDSPNARRWTAPASDQRVSSRIDLALRPCFVVETSGSSICTRDRGRQSA